jgi:CheY-like chemotaxis protein
MMQSDKEILANSKPAANSVPIRTLLVDDSLPVLDMLASILQRDGRATVIGTAKDGWEVLPEALRLAPDLVLMDLHLPRIDGAEATRYLKLLPNAPRVFIVTADDSPASYERSKASGADAFVAKSADIEARLKSELDNWFGAKGSSTEDSVD